MMKRLNFLRTSLDSHNPHETTLRMRDNAQKKRDERILELWRKDQMQPTVEQLVSKMVTTKAGQPRHDYWSDGEHNNNQNLDGESIMENDMQSIASAIGPIGNDKDGPSTNNKLKQNSLFSSVGHN